MSQSPQNDTFFHDHLLEEGEKKRMMVKEEGVPGRKVTFQATFERAPHVHYCGDCNQFSEFSNGTCDYHNWHVHPEDRGCDMWDDGERDEE